MKINLIRKLLIICSLLSMQVSSSFPNLSCQVTVLDLETAEVNWTVRHPGQFNMGMEIVFGPEGVRYYIVQPILNPIARSTKLENLLPFNTYHLVIRTIPSTESFLQSDKIFFTTSALARDDDAIIWPRQINLEEFILVLFVLLLWVAVISLFFQRWGKIRSLLPYQPVYSKEMVEKIEKIEIEKKIGSNRTSFSFYPERGAMKAPNMTFSTCQTNSTIWLPYFNNLDMAGGQMRRTKSAEHIGCPMIVIDKSCPSQISISSQSLSTDDAPQLGQLLNIPRGEEIGAKQRKNGICRIQQ